MMQTKQRWRLALLAAMLAAFSVSTAWAQGSDSKDKAMKIDVAGELQTVESNGSKSLALKVMQAVDAQGNEVAAMSGQTVKLAADARTRALAAKHSAGTKLIVKGTLNVPEKLLTVMTYKVDDGKGSDNK